MSITGKSSLLQEHFLSGAIRRTVAFSGGTVTLTTASTTCGGVTLNLTFESLGTTFPTVLADILHYKGNGRELLTNLLMYGARPGFHIFGRVYQFGVSQLFTGGNNYSANFTGRVQRKKYNTLSDVVLLPVIFINNAPSGNAPDFSVQYTNQDGNNVSSKNTVLPSATTVAGGAYFIRLATGDRGCLSINGVTMNVTSDGNTASAMLFGLELNATYVSVASSGRGGFAPLFAGPLCIDLKPGTPSNNNSVDSFFFMGSVQAASMGTTGKLELVNVNA